MSVRAFFVRADGRLHPPWRMLLFVVVALVWLIPIGLVYQLVAPLLLRSGLPWAPDSLTMTGIIFALALLGAHAVMLRVDHRSWSDVALDAPAARPRLLARGWVVGALTIGVPCLLLLATHWLAIRPEPAGNWIGDALIMSLGLLPAALWEELFARGYLFATLREWLGWPVAMLISSAAFGLMHLGNPGADAQSVIMVFLAGVFLAAVLLTTKSLYAAWMAHWAWNWVLAVPLHVAVSGIAVPHPYYETVDAGPDWATGGPWGPEGGTFAGASMLLVLGWWWWRNRRDSRPNTQDRK